MVFYFFTESQTFLELKSQELPLQVAGKLGTKIQILTLANV